MIQIESILRRLSLVGSSATRGARAGFSLIEVLFALSISLIIGGTIISVLMSQIQLTATQNRNIINQQELRETLHFVTEEILAMGTGSIEPYIATATATELMYVGDLDNDGSPDRVRYVFDDATGQLLRTLSSTADGGTTWTDVSTDALLNDVNALGFIYYGADNTDPVGDVDAITAVEVGCTLDTAQNQTAFTSGKLAPQSMVARITIRNRKL